MSDYELQRDETGGGPRLTAVVVGAGVVVMLLLVGWMVFIQFFSFGAGPGQPVSGQIQPVPITETVDKFLLHVPVLGDMARSYLNTIGSGDTGPQQIWRKYIFFWGILMILCCVFMLIIKRVFEPTNDETTVMHLKGDTDTALRAKGGRG